MIRRPAQHAAITFLSQKGIGLATLLLVVLLFPIIMLLIIGVKIGIVILLHEVVKYFTGAWTVLTIASVITAVFTLVSFVSRTMELGSYYTGQKIYVHETAKRVWYGLVFAVDFIVTDMLVLAASSILAYVYWMSAQSQSFAPFMDYAQPFIALSIFGGLLQILFSSYYLTHPRLHKVYLYATRRQHIPQRVPAQEMARRVSKDVKKSIKTAKNKRLSKKKLKQSKSRRK